MISPLLSPPGVCFAAPFSATLAPGSSEAVLACWIHQNGHSLLLMVAALGNTLGGITTWLLGLLAAYQHPHPLDQPDGSRHRSAVVSVRRYGIPRLLMSWLPVVGDGFCFAAGGLRLPFWRSVVALALRSAAIVLYVAG